MPFFSVIVPVYNRRDEVEDLLRSLSQQTDKNFEIILVEDGRIEAVGSHEALQRSCPAYRTMVELQKLEEEGGEQNA